jgi:hypothetical protein
LRQKNAGYGGTGQSSGNRVLSGSPLKKVIPLSERKIIDYLKEKRPDYLVMFDDWDRFFNLLHPANDKYFQLIHTILPLYPTDMRYRVYECNWAL